MKPRVIVIRAQKKSLFVHLWRDQFISSFTWERLLQKHKNHAYKPLPDTLSHRLESYHEHH